MFKSEVEMCRELTEMISGILIPTRHKFIPEVPRGYGNDHLDMLFIKDNGGVFGVEYKLGNAKKLNRQVSRNDHVIGILNQPFDHENFRYSRLFQFTGQDWEIEKIAQFINGRRKFDRHHSSSDLLSVYWWGFQNTESSLEGGLANCKRISFFEVYKNAIKNLQEKYDWKLDEYVIYRILGTYAISSVKKYFKQVLEEAGR